MPEFKTLLPDMLVTFNLAYNKALPTDNRFDVELKKSYIRLPFHTDWEVISKNNNSNIINAAYSELGKHVLENSFVYSPAYKKINHDDDLITKLNMSPIIIDNTVHSKMVYLLYTNTISEAVISWFSREIPIGRYVLESDPTNMLKFKVVDAIPDLMSFYGEDNTEITVDEYLSNSKNCSFNYNSLLHENFKMYSGI